MPLSAPAREFLRGLAPEASRHRADGLILPGAAGTPFAGWSKSKGALDRAITKARVKAAAEAGEAPAALVPWNVHDLRRTVATGLKSLGVRLEVTKAVLNHISGSRGGIAGVYQRNDWHPRSGPRWIPGRRRRFAHQASYAKENVLRLRAR